MYKYLNLHPKGLRVDDCVKRAIAKATDIDYQRVALELNRYKKVTGCKLYNENKNCEPYVEKVLHMQKLSFKVEPGKPRMNGERFCQQFPIGESYLSFFGEFTIDINNSNKINENRANNDTFSNRY